jgi:hypothetical protein
MGRCGRARMRLRVPVVQPRLGLPSGHADRRDRTRGLRSRSSRSVSVPPRFVDRARRGEVARRRERRRRGRSRLAARQAGRVRDRAPRHRATRFHRPRSTSRRARRRCRHRYSTERPTARHVRFARSGATWRRARWSSPSPCTAFPLRQAQPPCPSHPRERRP